MTRYSERDILKTIEIPFFKSQSQDIKVRRIVERNGSLLLFVTYKRQEYVVKVCTSTTFKNAQQSSGYFEREVEFYTKIAPLLGDRLAVRCYAADYREGSGAKYIVLNDLSRSYFQPAWPSIPGSKDIISIIDYLARLHAEHWGRLSIAGRIGRSLTNSLVLYERIRDRFQDFARQSCITIAVDDLKLFERALELWPTLYERRMKEPCEVTLTHGDAHPWNFMLPKGDQSGDVFMLDWQNWGMNPGAYDLAYLIGLLWCPRNGSICLEELVKRYHSELQRLGISHYRWSDFWYDFRLFTMRNMYEPIVRWNMGLDESHWSQLVLSTIDAYKEMRCEEIF